MQEQRRGACRPSPEKAATPSVLTLELSGGDFSGPEIISFLSVSSEFRVTSDMNLCVFQEGANLNTDGNS